MHIEKVYLICMQQVCSKLNEKKSCMHIFFLWFRKITQQAVMIGYLTFKPYRQHSAQKRRPLLWIHQWIHWAKYYWISFFLTLNLNSMIIMLHSSWILSNLKNYLRNVSVKLCLMITHWITLFHHLSSPGLSVRKLLALRFIFLYLQSSEKPFGLHKIWSRDQVNIPENLFKLLFIS